VDWRGATPAKTRQWRFSIERLEELLADNRIQLKPDGTPSMNGYKMYLADSLGRSLQDIWDDIPNITGISSEKLGWQTQKPIALLERIIEACSNPDDIVLDPFCGCGTALVAAQKLGRRWVGIDITYLSITVMRDRLMRSFNLADVEVEGRPTEVEGARHFAVRDRYQFQWWALDLVRAQPVSGVEKKGADKGVDGVISFTGPGLKAETCIVSVKSGGVGVGMIDEFRGAMAKNGAVMGLFVTLEEPSKPMKAAAAAAGYYHSDISGRDYPVVQILTIKDLLEDGRKPDLPLLLLPPYQQAQPIKKAAEQKALFGD
jgi:site-specific DNA-methyltransferase (adenine-specific)